MPITMAGELMAAGLDFTHQVRKMLGHPSDKEESRLGVVLVKEIKHTARVGHHARGPLVPGFTAYRAGKGLHLKIVLNVHTQDVCDLLVFGVLVGQSPFFFETWPVCALQDMPSHPCMNAMHMPLESNKGAAIAITYGRDCRISPSRVKKIAYAGQSACVRRPTAHVVKLGSMRLSCCKHTLWIMSAGWRGARNPSAPNGT